MTQLEIIRLAENNRKIMERLTNARTLEETGNKKIIDRTKRWKISSDNFFVLAARYEGKYVGWCSACAIPKAHDKVGVMYVDELWVKETYRRKGIAEGLLNEVIELAKKEKVWKMRLHVGEDNPAKYLYEKVGFDLNTALIGEFNIEDLR